jgi:hypothetical protein
MATQFTGPQLQTLKAAILAETDPGFVTARTNGQTGVMAAFFNSDHASVKAWDKNANWEAIQNAIEYAKYTPSVANMPTDIAGLCRLVGILLKLTVQQNLLIGMQQRVDARDVGTIDAILDGVVQVQSGVGGASTSPGGANGVNVANALTRPAKNGESVFGGTDITKGTVTAKILTFEGNISDGDINAAQEA